MIAGLTPAAVALRSCGGGALSAAHRARVRPDFGFFAGRPVALTGAQTPELESPPLICSVCPVM